MSADLATGWSVAFRGSLAVAAGLGTRSRPRGPRFLRLFPDVYVRVGDRPPGLELRTLAACRLVEAHGVPLAYSAAPVLGADRDPAHDVAAEVTVPGGGQHVGVETVGLPRPQVQWVVQDVLARTAVGLDLARPEHEIGIEYEGEGEVHAWPEAVPRDARRYTRLVDRGWRIYRHTTNDVDSERERIVAELTRVRQRTR